MKSIRQILNSSSYSEQINSDQWRDFARNIRRERNFCECCKRGDVSLQVHHIFYDFDRKLWEYGAGEVMVLCVECHQSITTELRQFRKHVFKYFSGPNLKILNGALAVAMTQYDPAVFVHALAEFVGNSRLVENHAKAWGMKAENKVPFRPSGIAELGPEYTSEFDKKS